jgi:hypothetical protein
MLYAAVNSEEVNVSAVNGRMIGVLPAANAMLTSARRIGARLSLTSAIRQSVSTAIHRG